MAQFHAVARDADDDAAEDIDGQNDEARYGIAADELADAPSIEPKKALSSSSSRRRRWRFLVVDEAGPTDRRRSPSACLGWRRE